MPTGNTIPVPPEFPASFPLTEPERDLEAWYFSFPTAKDTPIPRPGPEVSDRPEVSRLTRPDGPLYIGIPIAVADLALLTTGCVSTRGSLDRQLAAERERVAELHGGLR